MVEHNLHRERIKQLLALDPTINETQMKEFRMQLAQTVELSEATAKQTRRRILIALGIYLTATIGSWYALSQLGNATVDPKVIRLRELILIPLNFSALAAFVILALLVTLYLFKYWPRLNRARFDLLSSMMLELQQQVSELKQGLGRRD